MDPNAAPTVRIKYPANLRVGYCQIPAGDFDPTIHELWQEKSAIGTDSGDQFSEEQLRALIKEATGKAPHHKLSYEKLVEEYNRLNAE